MITICSFITPLQKHRNVAAEIIGDAYFEVFLVDSPLDVCFERDVKGLYKKAKANQIPDFTGISSGFERPENPNLVLSTAYESAEESMKKVYYMLISRISPLPEFETLFSLQ